MLRAIEHLKQKKLFVVEARIFTPNVQLGEVKCKNARFILHNEGLLYSTHKGIKLVPNRLVKTLLERQIEDDLRSKFNYPYWAAKPNILEIFDEGLYEDTLYATEVFLSTTPGTNFTYTSDATWNNSDNTVECLGPGGAGAGGANHRTGGGGGAYSLISNFSFATPGTTTATCNVGAGATGQNGTGVAGLSTWFNNASDPGNGADNTKCAADGGQGGAGGTGSTNGGTGGNSSLSWGTTKNSGGRGGNLTGGSGSGGSGGGGAAGPDGAGNNGGDSTSTGANITTTGGTADAGNANRATIFDATHGCGDGGNGVAPGSPGNVGLNYGGGGSGARNSSGNAVGGSGADGLIVLNWTPLAAAGLGRMFMVLQ